MNDVGTSDTSGRDEWVRFRMGALHSPSNEHAAGALATNWDIQWGLRPFKIRVLGTGSGVWQRGASAIAAALLPVSWFDASGVGSWSAWSATF